MNKNKKINQLIIMALLVFSGGIKATGNEDSKGSTDQNKSNDQEDLCCHCLSCLRLKKDDKGWIKLSPEKQSCQKKLTPGTCYFYAFSKQTNN